MRTIEEIRKDIDNAEEKAREWYKKRDAFYEELKLAQTEVKNYKDKYISLNWDIAVMYVTDQSITKDKVILKGIRIFEHDNLLHDGGDTYSGDFLVGVSAEPLEFNIKEFKDLTIGQLTNITEITKDEFDDYIRKMLEEYKGKLNFEEWL